MKEKKLKKLHVGLKRNVADWNLQRCDGALAGYICGELHNAMYMKKDKFDILFSITNEVSELVKSMIVATEIAGSDFDLEGKVFVDGFEITVFMCTHLNDFDIYIKRMEDDDE